MHVSEGVLSLPVISAGWAVSAGALAYSLRRTASALLPRMAVFASAFFLASLVRVPIGPASAHFALLGLMGVTLGWGAFAAIFLSLALQALLFQFGGLLSLGVNAAIMGLPALAAYALFARFTRKTRTASAAAAFLAGFCAIALATALLWAALALSDQALGGVMRLLVLANLPLAVLEGLVTVFVVAFLRRVAPDMLAA